MNSSFILVDSKATSAELRNVIVSNFPIFLGKEFQLLKSTVGGPGKPLIAVFGSELVPDAKLLAAACSGVVYIRPLNPVINENELSDDDDLPQDMDTNETNNGMPMKFI